jgi:hypothetical protein
MANLYCLEIGIRERKNLCRMTKSIVLLAPTPADAIRQANQLHPTLSRCGEVQHVFQASHVIVDWPSGTVDVPEIEQPKN